MQSPTATSPAEPDRYSIMHTLTQELLTALNLRDLLWKVVRVVGERLGLYYVTVALVENDRSLVFHAAHGGGLDNELLFREKGHELVLSVTRGITGKAVSERRSIVVDDVTTEPAYHSVPFLPQTRSEMAVPILRRDRVLGVLDVQADEAGAFEQEAVEQIERVASLVGIAIENARVVDRLEQQNRRLELSAAVSRIAVGATDVEDLASRVSVKLREVLDMEFVGVSILRRQLSVLELASSASEPGFVLTPPQICPMGEGLQGRAAETGCTLVFDALVEPNTQDALCPESRSELAVPLTSGGQVVGCLHLASRRPHRFDPEDAQLLEAVAGPVAHALASARALDRLEQLRSELTGMIVHDLRNPMMVVLTALRVLERAPGVQQDDRCQRYLRNAGVAGDEVLRMVGSLLDLQKLESGELELQRTQFSLADVVERVVANNRVLAEVEEVDLSVNTAPALPPVMADLDLVMRTVDNLVGNAVKFTPMGGTVAVAVREATSDELADQVVACARGVLVEVVDSGEGIPEDDHERIFEKFGVVESRRHHVKVSTGLGLAMCMRVVTAHRGAIWVDSSPGEGSRFAFILPIDQGS